MAAGLKKYNPLKEKPDLFCGWHKCSFSCSTPHLFNKHVSKHIGDPELVVVDEISGEDLYECQWMYCDFTTQDPKHLTRHIKFHGIHTRLKALGTIVVDKKNLPACMYNDYEQYTVPSQEDPLICLWSCCGIEYPGQPEFLEHVSKEHVIPSDGRRCRWADCKAVFSTRAKLTEHVRVHTCEKVVACPTCGQTFANITKFADHRNRQLESRTFQCTHCLGYFPTERILTEHMRQHVHHYKCSFCDMTCSTPSILATHIRFRHLDYKCFTCPTCSCKFKTRTDLRVHFFSHDAEGRFLCEEADCDFNARTLISLTKHYEKDHNKEKDATYACHLCKRIYLRGARLTKHLLKSHDLKKPSGYSRFVYRREEDGYYRLQTTRLESLEVTVDVEKSLQMKEHLMQSGNEDDDPDDPKEQICITEPLITIDVLDETGKVVTSESVFAGKTLPPNATIVAIAS